MISLSKHFPDTRISQSCVIPGSWPLEVELIQIANLFPLECREGRKKKKTSRLIRSMLEVLEEYNGDLHHLET